MTEEARGVSGRDYVECCTKDANGVITPSTTNDDIYVTNESGAEPVRLTTNTAVDHQPTVSPNGKEIVFRSTRDGNGEIYMMDAAPESETNKPQRLTNDDPLDKLVNDSRPVFSPDGKK